MVMWVRPAPGVPRRECTGAIGGTILYPQKGQPPGVRADTRKKGFTMSVDSVSGNAVAPKPHERFIQSLTNRAEREGATIGRDVSMSQIDKVLEADTEDEVWDADEGGTVSGQDMIDVELQFQSLTVAPSADEYDATLGVFVNIKAVRLDNGDEVTVNTGADKIISKLVKFESMGLLPIEGVIRGVKTRNGNMLVLRRVPKRAVPGSAE